MKFKYGTMNPTENTSLLSSSAPTGENQNTRSHNGLSTLRKGAVYLTAVALVIMGVSIIADSLGFGCPHKMFMNKSSNLRGGVDKLGLDTSGLSGFKTFGTGGADGSAVIPLAGDADASGNTMSPTLSPTVSPTTSPTVSPTTSPTVSPTVSPTLSPVDPN